MKSHTLRVRGQQDMCVFQTTSSISRVTLPRKPSNLTHSPCNTSQAVNSMAAVHVKNNGNENSARQN